MKKYTQEEVKQETLSEVLEKHKMWLEGTGGKRANLSYAYLRDANLRYANLRYANLSGANLSNANLWGVDLRDANLSGANLRYANLRYANLSGANLSNANLCGVKTDSTTSFFALQCPEEGSFTAYKKACEHLVKLIIPEDALRSSATSRKCRASKAYVVEIINIKTGEKVGAVASEYDEEFIYRAGESVKVSDFDKNRWNECAPGIHFFITKEEAEKY